MGEITLEQKVVKPKRENGREKRGRQQKSLLIRFPGYDDLECHPSGIHRFRNGFHKEEGEDAPEDSLCRDAGWRDPGGRYALGNESAFIGKGI